MVDSDSAFEMNSSLSRMEKNLEVHHEMFALQAWPLPV